MRLSQSIKVNVQPILEKWEFFARTMLPPASTLSMAELRDRAQDILRGSRRDGNLSVGVGAPCAHVGQRSCIRLPCCTASCANTRTST